MACLRLKFMGTTVPSHLCDPCATPPRSPGRWAAGVLMVGLAVGLLGAFALQRVIQESAPRSALASVTVRMPAVIARTSPAVLPLPTQPPVLGPREELGRRLFHDPRLSADRTLSCASCHSLERGGMDGRRVSVGVNGAEGSFNAPTVFNASLQIAQFWDGRARTLAEQAAGPILNPVEMAGNWTDIVHRLEGDATYRQAFLAVYGSSTPQPQQVTDALAAFERTLVTPNSRFDQYLMGVTQALSAQELRGYQRFQSLGCISCHQGQAIGGNLFQPFGVLSSPDEARRRGRTDPGRYAVTGLERDRGVFKVPSLRNVAVTAPYFHDGRVGTLEEAVWLMGKAQLGRDLSRQEVDDLVAFLHTLTGQWQGKYLQ